MAVDPQHTCRYLNEHDEMERANQNIYDDFKLREPFVLWFI